MTSSVFLKALAERHLPAEAAAHWVGLLRPAARLFTLGDDADVVGQLGGDPALPDHLAWPQWPGHGPLTFIASVDCAALPVDELDIDLPVDGTLLLFYFDGQFDDGKALVLFDDPTSAAGAQLIYLPAGTAAEPRVAPDGINAYRRRNLAAEIVTTCPQWGDAVLQETRLADGESLEDIIDATEFSAVSADAVTTPAHQLGGHAFPIQGPVADEIAVADAAADRWVLLAQIDSDDDMMWGDAGMLYWMIKADDLAAKRFDAARFTWQCS